MQLVFRACLLLLLMISEAAADADILPAQASKELSTLYYLSMARGHLLASIELAKDGNLDQSVLHSRHTLDEAWSALVRFLPIEETQVLRNRLDAMNEAVALKLSVQQIEKAHDAAHRYLAELTEASFAADVPRTRQRLELVRLLLQQACAEYEEAWQDFELHDAAEYQDGYAFVAVANAELEVIYPELRARNAKAADEIEKTIARLNGAWPSPRPPERPLMSKPLLRALVASVEINARQFSH